MSCGDFHPFDDPCDPYVIAERDMDDAAHRDWLEQQTRENLRRRLDRRVTDAELPPRTLLGGRPVSPAVVEFLAGERLSQLIDEGKGRAA